MSTDILAHLNAMWEEYQRDLEELADHPEKVEEWLEANVLSREDDNSLLLAYGGPTAWITVKGYLICTWSPERVEGRVSHKAMEGLDVIWDYLREVGE